MAAFSIREIYEAACAAGFSPDQAATWTAIAMAESGGRTEALNSRGEHSVGLWQINVDPKVRANKWGDLNDPVVNARAAFEVSGHGRDMRPWTTTHDHNKGSSHDYRTYLDDVESSVGVKGDWRGVSGYNAPLPTPLPTQPEPQGLHQQPLAQTAAVSSYDQISQGAPIGSDVDTDGDGLTDGFEVVRSHSSPTSADTDKDGLTDGFEVVRSHSSPTSADADKDKLSDAVEVALGTNSALFDTDDDGLSDAVEVRFGTDPLKADAGDGSQHSPSAPPPTPSVTTNLPLTATPKPAPGGAVVTSAEPSMAASAQPTALGTSVAAPTTPSVVDRFVEVALDQKGDPYRYGAETKLSDADPDAFDCSELTQWAAHQVGVTIPDGAEWQYLDLKGKDTLMPVEQALKTKGALLFYFSSEPTASGPRPSRAHVAISLGDGRTIEARGRAYGVNEFAAGHRFTAAGRIPGLPDTKPALGFEAHPPAVPNEAAVSYDRIEAGAPLETPVDTDGDGLTDAFEKLAGTSAKLADTDRDGLTDAFEALRSHTDPLSRDTDKDGRYDAAELAAGTDPGRIAGIAGVSGRGRFAENIRGGIKDADKDGLTDMFEKRAGLNAKMADTDKDGLRDAMEISLGTDGTKKDTDMDGLTDAIEVRFGFDPLKAGSGLGPGAGFADPHAAGEPFVAEVAGTDLDTDG